MLMLSFTIRKTNSVASLTEVAVLHKKYLRQRIYLFAILIG